MTPRGSTDNGEKWPYTVKDFDRMMEQADEAIGEWKRRRVVPVRGARFSHRRYVWRLARERNRWPTRVEWRFILLGRWPGF